MPGALKAGSVYVAVSAAIGEFTATLGKVVKAVEDTAKRVKEAMKGVADVGAIFAAAMGGAVLAAAQANADMRADLDQLKAYLFTFAVELGEAFAPFLRELVRAVGSVVGAFQQLSPQLKSAIAEFIVLGAGIGTGAAVLSKAAGLVEGVAKATGIVLVPALKAAESATKALAIVSKDAYPKIGAAVAKMEGGVLKSLARVAVGFGSVLLPIAAVAAAIAGLVLLAGSLYEAWNDSSTGLRDGVLAIWQSIKDLGSKLVELVAGWMDVLNGVIDEALAAILDAAAWALRKLSGLMAPLAETLGLEGISGMFAEMSKLTGAQLMKDLQSSAAFVADKAKQGAQYLADGAAVVGKEVAEGVSKGLAYSLKGVQRIGKDTGLSELPDKLKSVFGGLLSGPAATVRGTSEGDAGVAGRFARLRVVDPFAEFYGRLADEAQKAAAAAAARAREARRAIEERFAGMFGELGSLVESFMQGLAAGGIGGALAAVAADLVTRSEQFAMLVETLNGLIGLVADWLGKLVEPFIPLVGAIAHLIEAGLTALAPALEAMTAFIEPLIPPIMVLGELFAGLAPVIAVLVQVMALIQNPLRILAGPALKALFEVLKFVSSIILKVVKGLGDVWNGILGAVQSVFRKLADIEVLGVRPLGFLDGWADGLEKAKVDTDAMARALQALTGMTWEAAQEKAKETAEVLRNRKEMEKATQALTNVPSAFKYALASFEVQDVQGPMVPVPTAPPPPAPPPPVPEPTPPPAPQPGGEGQGPGRAWWVTPPMLADSININVTSVPEAVAELEGLMDKLFFDRSGTRGRAGRFAVQEG